MNNLILFLNSFLSYLLCFGLIVLLVVIAVILGVKLRKRKDEKNSQAVLELDKKQE